MCTYNTITSHTYHFEIQKRDSEESLLTFVNLFPRIAFLLVLSAIITMFILCLLYPHGLYSLLEFEINLSIYLSKSASTRENLTLVHANNKGAALYLNQRRLISAFIIRLLTSIIAKLAS